MTKEQIEKIKGIIEVLEELQDEIEATSPDWRNYWNAIKQLKGLLERWGKHA